MRGVTLVELIVALAVIGLLVGLAALGFRSLQSDPPPRWPAALDSARAAAVRDGRATIVTDTAGRRVLLLPDGRAVGRGVDPLLGEPIDAAR